MSKFFRYLSTVFLTVLIIFTAIRPAYAGASVLPKVDLPHNELGFALYSPHILLMEASSGKVLYEYHASEEIYPASTTKIMTAILTLENCKLSDVATVSHNAVHSIPSGYASANLQEGEELTVSQLLHALLIPSANDAAVVLAEHIAGSVEDFAEMMNTRALELGCTNTHFVNPYGIHAENHTTTTYDMALIGRYAMQNTTFRSIVQKTQYTLPTTNKYDKEDRIFRTTNELLRSGKYSYSYCTGGKTGYTNPAGSCIVVSAKQDDREFIVSIMGASKNENSEQSRELDCKSLFEYAFENYQATELVSGNTVVSSIQVPGATQSTKDLEVYAKDSIHAILEKDASGEVNVSSEIVLRENLQAPFSEGEVVGSIIYSVDDTTYETELIASHDVYRIDYIKILLYILLAIFILMMLTTFGEMHRKKKRDNPSKKKKKSKGRHYAGGNYRYMQLHVYEK